MDLLARCASAPCSSHGLGHSHKQRPHRWRGRRDSRQLRSWAARFDVLADDSGRDFLRSVLFDDFGPDFCGLVSASEFSHVTLGSRQGVYHGGHFLDRLRGFDHLVCTRSPHLPVLAHVLIEGSEPSVAVKAITLNLMERITGFDVGLLRASDHSLEFA